MVDGAAARFGDDRHRAFVVGPLHHAGDTLHEVGGESGVDRFLGGVAFVDEEVEEAVGLVVAEAEVIFVCLVGDEVGRGGLVDDGGWDADGAGDLADLGFVEVAYRVDGRGEVAKNGAVAEEEFGFVAGADDEGVVSGRAVIDADHAGAGHDIPFAERRNVGGFGEKGFDHVGDFYRFAADAEVVDDEVGVEEAVAGGGAIGEFDGEDVFWPHGVGGDVAGEGGVDAAGEAEDHFFEADFADFVADELDENGDGDVGVDV